MAAGEHPAEQHSAVATLDPESAEWVRGLTARGADHDSAVERLHGLLVRIDSRQG
ncbi:MAG: hypothetical protein ACR2KJ_01920 [Jatrophihabitans sp.]